MGTVFCPNKLCGKEVSDQFEKCPFCGTPLHEPMSEHAQNDVESIETSRSTYVYVERSGWHTFATVMIVLGGIAVAITLILVLLDDWHRNWTPFFIVLGGYLMELGFWAIVQLLAGIKQGVDTLLQNTKK